MIPLQLLYVHAGRKVNFCRKQHTRCATIFNELTQAWQLVQKCIQKIPDSSRCRHSRLFPLTRLQRQVTWSAISVFIVAHQVPRS